MLTDYLVQINRDIIGQFRSYIVRLVHICSPVNQQLSGLNVAFLQGNKEWCISFLYIAEQSSLQSSLHVYV